MIFSQLKSPNVTNDLTNNVLNMHTSDDNRKTA